MNAHITGADLKQAGGKTITLGGRDYEIALDMNAICDLEERYGDFEKAMDAIVRKDKSGKEHVSMKDMRFILCTMLRHTDEEMTERHAGQLITTDNMQEVMDALGQAMGNAKGQQSESSEEEAKKEESPRE